MLAETAPPLAIAAHATVAQGQKELEIARLARIRAPWAQGLAVFAIWIGAVVDGRDTNLIETVERDETSRQIVRIPSRRDHDERRLRGEHRHHHLLAPSVNLLATL